MFDYRNTWLVFLISKAYLWSFRLMYRIGYDGYDEERYHDFTVSILGVFLKLELPKTLPFQLGFPKKPNCVGVSYNPDSKKFNVLLGSLMILEIEFPHNRSYNWCVGTWVTYGYTQHKVRDTSKPVNFILSLFGIWIDLKLPLFKPDVEGKRKYGFSAHEDIFFIYNGLQVDDWTNKGPRGYITFNNPIISTWYLGVDHYDKHGEVYKSIRINENRLPNTPREVETVINACPELITFEFKDGDGTIVQGQVTISDQIHRRFSGPLKPLGYWVPKKIYRRMELDYGQEVGPKKGSWKGGTMTTSFLMKSKDIKAEITKATLSDAPKAADIVILM